MVTFNPSLRAKRLAEIEREADKVRRGMGVKGAMRGELGDAVKYANITSATKDGEVADIVVPLNQAKVDENAKYGGFDPDCRRGFPYEEAIKGSPHQDLIKQLIEIRKTPDLGSTSFLAYSESGLLVLRRGDTYLYVNATDKPIKKEGNVICSHNYADRQIAPNGFVIIR